MFRSWRRSPRASMDPVADTSSSRRRSMPLPMQGYDDGTSFKNSSGPESNEHVPTPEFSKVKSVGSVTSLRRLVATAAVSVAGAATPQDGDAAVESAQLGSKDHSSPNDKKEDSKDVANDQPHNTKDAETQKHDQEEDPTKSTKELKRENSWIWSLFKSERQETVKDPVKDTLRDPVNDSVEDAGHVERPVERPLKESVVEERPNEPQNDSSTSKNNSRESANAWAFWARKSTPTSESGSLAVSGTESEHDPRNAEISMPSPKRRKQPDKKSSQSLVIPEFTTVPQMPSRTARLASLFWSGSSTSQSSHLFVKSPVKPKRAVVIGVHGYFPAKMTRAILGEPTGTSIKFANEAESRLLEWFSETYPNEEVRIDKIALEGEGKIARRVDRLYELLLNWENLLKHADFIFFAAHSQGAVVTINILARLLEKHVVSAKTQLITVLTMAGSLLGPMPGMDETYVMKAITRIEHDSLAELFGLQDVTSSLSQDLQHSLKSVLYAGVKVVLVGSADDQLIPLYSALAMHAHHPNLFRAVYLDGDDVRPEVIAPLLQLATQQLNLGHTDHGIIRELSSLLAGALTSKGHSKLYSHDKVYDLGLRIALQTSASVGIDPEYDLEFKVPKPAGANPYVLPWAAQALVRDCIDSKVLQPTVDSLLLQFHAWKPESKSLKDLKLRLGGMGRLSKL